ncbi:MAG: hypothetical protein MK133_11445, partial [Planctomycetes bacterium]|nr:hypothetical protein [Planctomycetota bacterium]
AGGLIVVAVLAAVVGIKSGGSFPVGTEGGFLVLLLLGPPLGSIFCSLLVRKLTGGGKQRPRPGPSEQNSHKKTQTGVWENVRSSIALKTRPADPKNPFFLKRT